MIDTNARLVDISFYQSDPATTFKIDFVKMAKQVDGVICRAGQNLWIDREFRDYWTRSKGVLPRGSYWFYDSRIDPYVQASKWAEALQGDLGELPLFADFEDIYGGPFGNWNEWYKFLERVKQLFPGKEIGIYTGFYYWKENTLDVGIPAASLAYFKQYPLWIANYGVAPPMIPKPWDAWTIWQYGDNGDGIAHGVESLDINVNYFNGSVDVYRARFGLDEVPGSGEGEANMRYQFTDMSVNRALRSGANALAARVTNLAIPAVVLTTAGYIRAGAMAEGDEIVTLTQAVKDNTGKTIGMAGDQWLHVLKVGGYAVDGYTAVKHMGVVVGSLVDNGTPTEPPPVSDEEEDVIVNVDTGKKIVTITTEKSAPWAVYVDGVAFVKGL